MSITLKLKPEVEARAAREAAARGVSVETLLADVIEENLNGGEEKPFHQTATTEEWVREFNEWVNSHDYITAPPLSDEAMSRESIYEREDYQL